MNHAETTQITLSDFLLARIADDEAHAKTSAQFGGRAYKGPANPDRVLAECEAKRRIVEEVGSSVGNRDSNSNYGPDVWQNVIEILAAVYSDHPDYRDEWKP